TSLEFRCISRYHMDATSWWRIRQRGECHEQTGIAGQRLRGYEGELVHWRIRSRGHGAVTVSGRNGDLIPRPVDEGAAPRGAAPLRCCGDRTMSSHVFQPHVRACALEDAAVLLDLRSGEYQGLSRR